jgi:hypothetical protein
MPAQRSASAPPVDAASAFAAEFAALHGYVPLDQAGKAATSEEELRAASFEAGTTALCLSGGGIRSASFCLGVVQSLARRGLLARFHYLSTVSGGGYLGALVAAWAYRAPGGTREVEQALCAGVHEEGSAFDMLRRHVRYLAPKQGLLSIDTWTLAATYIRNFLLNALIWLPAIGALLALPLLVGAALDALVAATRGRALLQSFANVSVVAGVAILLYGTFRLRRTISRDRERQAEQHGAAQPTTRPSANRSIQIALFAGVVLLAAGGYALSYADPASFWRSLTRGGADLWSRFSPLPDATPPMLIFGAALALMQALSSLGYRPIRRGARYRLAIAAAGAVGGFATGAAAGFVIDLFTRDGAFAGDPRLYVTLVPPLLLASWGLGEILFVGGASRLSSDFDREWWSRAGAWTSMFGAAWLALFGVALYGPLAFAKLREAAFGMSAYTTLLVLAALVARLAMNREAPVATESRPTWRALLADRALDIAAFLALVAIVVGIAWLVDRALPFVAIPTNWLGLAAPSLELDYSLVDVFLLILVLGVVVGLAGLCVNVNRFSLHAMYRDRLIRTFLGASRADYPDPPWPLDDTREYRESRQFEARNADRFIKFDRDDNPIFRWLKPGREPVLAERKAPLLVVNAALNLAAGRNLAWQERKSATFTFTPLFVGNPWLGYRGSDEYGGDAGGITLGTAMAISGAAVSPNAGAQSSPVRTFLLTLFNARLGWWIGHPEDLPAVRSLAPKFAVGALVDELLGRTHDRKRWLFVSDGGHFENLGLYEAVRRGCRDIVVVDASCDPDRNFDDLGNAIRKIRVDLGVRIERTGPWLIGGRDLQAQGRYCALFDVIYPDDRIGSLLYIKPALYPKAEGLPIDVLQYAGRSATFPHESTARQFFGESQFEAYRALGAFEVDAMIEGVETPNRPDPTPIESVAEFIEIAALRMTE